MKYKLSSAVQQIKLIIIFATFLMLGIVVFVLLFGILSGGDPLRDTSLFFKGLLDQGPMEPNAAFDWSDKLLAVGVALAGSFTTVMIALSTFAVQKESEIDKTRRALLTEYGWHQDLLDRIEDIFREADDKLSQISAIDIATGKESAGLSENYWVVVREQQNAFWEAIETASRPNSGGPTLEKLWRVHFGRRGLFKRKNEASIAETYLRSTGMFRASLQQDKSISFDEIVRCLRSARADLNFEAMLWSFLARSVPDRFALLSERLDRDNTSKEQREGTKPARNYEETREPAQGKYGFLHKFLPYEAKSIQKLEEAIDQSDLRHQVNPFEFFEKSQSIMARIDDLGKESIEDEDEAKALLTDFKNDLDELLEAVSATSNLAKLVSDRIEKLSSVPFAGSVDLLRSRHISNEDEWLIHARAELTGLMLVPDMMEMGYEFENETYCVNLGLAFILDIIRIYSSDSAEREFLKVIGAGNRLLAPALSLGFFSKFYFDRNQVIERALIKKNSLDMSSVSAHTESIKESTSNGIKFQIGGNRINLINFGRNKESGVNVLKAVAQNRKGSIKPFEERAEFLNLRSESRAILSEVGCALGKVEEKWRAYDEHRAELNSILTQLRKKAKASQNAEAREKAASFMEPSNRPIERGRSHLRDLEDSLRQTLMVMQGNLSMDLICINSFDDLMRQVEKKEGALLEFLSQARRANNEQARRANNEFVDEIPF